LAIPTSCGNESPVVSIDLRKCSDGSKAKTSRKKYGIKYKTQSGLFVIFGCPKLKFKKGVKVALLQVTAIP